MNLDDWQVVANLLVAGLCVFLIWFVKNFLAAQLASSGATLAKIDARVAKLDELETIERRLKQASADVELAMNRQLHVDNLARSKELEFRERQLSEFFWPLYMRLQMDNAVWERIIQITPESPTRDRALAAKIERTFILPNHRKALAIIESKRHLAGMSAELEQWLLLYVRHVAVFTALRALDVHDRDPKDVGEPWPTGFFDAVRIATLRHEQEFARLRTNPQEPTGKSA